MGKIRKWGKRVHTLTHRHKNSIDDNK